MSHCKQIYQHLMTGKEINPMQALNLFGCFALSQRIGDLKRIHSVPVQSRLYYAPNGKKWGIYWLEPYYINQVKAGVIKPVFDDGK